MTRDGFAPDGFDPPSSLATDPAAAADRDVIVPSWVGRTDRTSTGHWPTPSPAGSPRTGP